jgi:hypothetical protein
MVKEHYLDGKIVSSHYPSLVLLPAYPSS